MKNILKNIIFVIYIVIAIALTVCLLSYNEVKITQFGDYSFIIVDGKDFEPDYNKGDLLIVDKGQKVNEGDKVFYYIVSDSNVKISLATVQSVDVVSEFETTYLLENGRNISNTNLLGSVNSVNQIEKLGAVLWILESKWGFLFIIVLPAFILFARQFMIVISDIKESKNNG